MTEPDYGKPITRYDLLLSRPHRAFLDALDDAFDEPGAFTAEHADDEFWLETKKGTRVLLIAHAVYPPAPPKPKKPESLT